MKKVAYLAAAAAMACALLGCAPTVEGDVDYVAEQCAGITDAETVNVVVTGERSSDMPIDKASDGSASFFIEGSECSAFLMFENVDAETLGALNAADIITAKGVTMPNLNPDDSIAVSDCELV